MTSLVIDGYQCRIEQDKDGFYCAECLELPGCLSDGVTFTDAVNNMSEAIRLYLEDRQHD